MYYIHVHVAPNFREIAENPMIENFLDKNSVIITFFCDYHRTAAPVRTIHVIDPPTIARHWASTVHANMKRKTLDKTYMGLSFCLQHLLVFSVWPSLQCGC